LVQTPVDRIPSAAHGIRRAQLLLRQQQIVFADLAWHQADQSIQIRVAARFDARAWLMDAAQRIDGKSAVQPLLQYP
jgi:hypothetical protein